MAASIGLGTRRLIFEERYDTGLGDGDGDDTGGGAGVPDADAAWSVEIVGALKSYSIFTSRSRSAMNWVSIGSNSSWLRSRSTGIFSFASPGIVAMARRSASASGFMIFP